MRDTQLQSTAQGIHGCGEQIGFCATGKGCSTPWRVGPALLTGPAGLLRVQHLKGSRSLLTLSVTLQLLKSLSLTSPLIFKKRDRPLETFIPSLLGSFPTLLCSRAPCGLRTSPSRVRQVRALLANRINPSSPSFRKASVLTVEWQGSSIQLETGSCS